ncbi:hypothetical protein RJ640_027933 [Escallonia rubra]|uniref:Uncharacterized protein n=1 Tax=Escallonia rubra TaxID=112253 RepID=A0AA88RMW0_9ASTE|nr:hypothetical protein RJ640_027933 [Escallonia rubra]
MTWSHRTLHRRGSASNGTNKRRAFNSHRVHALAVTTPSSTANSSDHSQTPRFRHYSVRTATMATINVEPSSAIELPKTKWPDLPLFKPNHYVQLRHNRQLHRTTASQCPADHGPVATNYDHGKSVPLPPSDRPPSLRLTFRRRQTHASAIGVPPKPGPWRPIKKRAFSSIDKPRMKRPDLPLTGGVGVFASVFADSFVRVFDLRDKEHATIIYESAEPDTPLVRLDWKEQDPRYMATIIMDSAKVVILDIRFPTLPVVELQRHQASVNAIAWAPHSSCHICTAGDDSQALI